jgi:phosphatidylinositol 4-kinase
MLDVMGGNTDSDAFIDYKEQTIRSFLIAKKYFPLFFEEVRLAEIAGLRCFNKNSLKNFEDRFMLNKNSFKSALKMNKIIEYALNNHRTILYDQIQYIQNKIAH